MTDADARAWLRWIDSHLRSIVREGESTKELHGAVAHAVRAIKDREAARRHMEGQEG